MARIFAQTLIRGSGGLIRDQSPICHLVAVGRRPPVPSPTCRLISFRGRSSRPEKLVQIFEIELETAADGGGAGPPPDGAAARGEAAARRLENVIHGVLARHAAPDWLPFIPGASYWVPPRRRWEGLAELLGRVSNPMSDEEVMSLTTERGYPCAAHLVGGISRYPDPADKNTGEETCIKSDGEDA